MGCSIIGSNWVNCGSRANASKHTLLGKFWTKTCSKGGLHWMSSENGQRIKKRKRASHKCSKGRRICLFVSLEAVPLFVCALLEVFWHWTDVYYGLSSSGGPSRCRLLPFGGFNFHFTKKLAARHHLHVPFDITCQMINSAALSESALFAPGKSISARIPVFTSAPSLVSTPSAFWHVCTAVNF